jgi:hypothetical protein
MKPKANKNQIIPSNEPLFDETGAELVVSGGDPSAPNPMLNVHNTQPPIDNLALVQNTSAIGVPGTFINRETGEAFEELFLVPFFIQKSRTLWPRGFARDRSPDCSSDNGDVAVNILPNGEIPLYPGATCEDCVHNFPKWEPREGLEPCAPGHTVLFYDIEAYSVTRMRFSGTGNRIVDRILKKPQVFQKQVVRIIAVKQTSDVGSWWQAVGTATGEITDEQRANILALGQQFLPPDTSTQAAA